MTIIASDSSSVRPTTVDTLYSLPGERYDFVVHADQTSGNYWIRLNAVGLCEGKVAEGLAVLSYHTPAEASDFDLAFLERSSPKAMLAYPIGTVRAVHIDFDAIKLNLFSIFPESECTAYVQ